MGRKETTSQVSMPARPYRSKKQRPCDACRRRRVGCFLEAQETACTLCRHRGTMCTFDSSAPIKKGRAAKKSLRRNYQTRQGMQMQRSRRRPLKAPPAQACVQNLAAVTAEDIAWEPYLGTDVPNRTALYVGSSSDQNVHLLRHLPFDNKNSFGSHNWKVGKILVQDSLPVYFTSYPNSLLDAKSNMYDYTYVDMLISPHRSTLLDLYYSYLHPNFAILESRDVLEAAVDAHSVPTTLLVAVYCSAIDLWKNSPDLVAATMTVNDRELRQWLFTAVMHEARTPSLRTIQTILLYMQLPPLFVREPNHPGFWSLTCQLVGLAEEIGLHEEPLKWKIRPEERRTRRILWWSVYMQDKWLAHWLGRPSHIHRENFNVSPLSEDDFLDTGANSNNPLLEKSISAFVALSRLTTVLSGVLDSFYTPARATTDPHELLARAADCRLGLTQSVSTGRFRLANHHMAAAVLAYYGISMSIQRALISCLGEGGIYDNEHETALFQGLFGVFEELQNKQHLRGLWLSYCKASMATVANFLTTALLSSVEDVTYRARKETLEHFRTSLQRLTTRYEFAALPLLRLDLLLKRFAGSSSIGQ